MTVDFFTTKCLLLRQDKVLWERFIQEAMLHATETGDQALKRAVEDEYELYLWRWDSYAY